METMLGTNVAKQVCGQLGHHIVYLASPYDGERSILVCDRCGATLDEIRGVPLLIAEGQKAKSAR